MESSHILGDAEECHSSESGWTMYIGSPMHSDDDDDGDDDSDDGDNDDEDYENQSVKPEDDSDDSMASDASSGPSHREHSGGNGKGGSGLSQVDKNDGKHCSRKKAKHPVEKNGYERRKRENEESGFTAEGANGGIQSSSDKVKKNGWFGKRK